MLSSNSFQIPHNYSYCKYMYIESRQILSAFTSELFLKGQNVVRFVNFWHSVYRKPSIYGLLYNV